MKATIIELLEQSLSSLEQLGTITLNGKPNIKVERAKDKSHGDYATNLALLLAKACQRQPRELAKLIVENIPNHQTIERLEIAGPGFINFYLKKEAAAEIIKTIFVQGKPLVKAP